MVSIKRNLRAVLCVFFLAWIATALVGETAAAPENRFTSATGMTGGPWNYVYDGNGLRVKKTNSASGTLY